MIVALVHPVNFRLPAVNGQDHRRQILRPEPAFLRSGRGAERCQQHYQEHCHAGSSHSVFLPVVFIFRPAPGGSVRFLLNNQTPDAPDASGKVSVCIPLDPVYPCRYLAANSSIGTGFE
jgi:hypothetical protein